MAEDLTPGGAVLPRPLRESERVMDIDAIQAVYAWGKARLMALGLEWRRAVLRAMDAELPVPSSPGSVVLRRVLATLWTLHEAGRLTAAQEAAALGVEILPVLASAGPGPDGEPLDSRLERTAAILERRLAAGQGAPDRVRDPYTRFRSGMTVDANRVIEEWTRRAAADGR